MKKNLICIIILALLVLIYIAICPTVSHVSTEAHTITSEPTQEASLIVTIQTDKEIYYPNETVIISGITKDSIGNIVENATIGLEVRDPQNSTLFLDITYSDINGFYHDQFRLHPYAILGEYHVYVTANALGYPPAKNQTTFTVETLGFSDIAIANISLSNPNPKINETITISITVSNLGTTTETFELSLNYTRLRDPHIGTQPVTLNPGEALIINFTWAPNIAGRYQILAYTSEIPEDIDPSNNVREITIYVRSQTSIGGATGTGFRKCFLT